jgi:hypothetical protein
MVTINSSTALLAYLEKHRSRWPKLNKYDRRTIADTAIFHNGSLRSVYAGPLRKKLTPLQEQKFMRELMSAVAGSALPYKPDHIYGEGSDAVDGCKPKDNWNCIPT